MLKEFLSKHITSQASVKNGGYVELGYGQVEPNHLSAQRTAQIYAQLPADPSIEVLEQGQFVKYDYAAGLVNFGSDDHDTGEWMLVYNETKLYREHQLDCEFAMIKGNYQARVYSPLDGDNSKMAEELYGPTRLLQGVSEVYKNGSFEARPVFDANGNVVAPVVDEETGKVSYPGVDDFGVASTVYDPYEMNDINNPEIKEDYRRRLFMKLRAVKHPEKMMPTGTTMVPRVFKTNVGDHYTTNMILESELAVGDILAPNAKGILAKDNSQAMKWQVVKVYTMPDHQKGVKILRIA